MPNDIRQRIRKKTKRAKPSRKEPLRGVSTGSTILNMACTGNPFIGLRNGHYYLLVGDSSSGKTWLCMSILAEASINPAFRNYRLIYDDAEGGALMDIERYFGPTLASRIEPPRHIDKQPAYSQVIEDFYYNITDAFNGDRPFIYIMDSIDSLDSKASLKKFEETKTAHRKQKEITGSYGDGKARINSEHLRKAINPLKDSGSILIIVNQTRDNLGFGFEKKSRSGGHALEFYAGISIWLSVKAHITATIQKRKRELGIVTRCRTKKNRITGKDRTVFFPIYHSHGIDDTGSCVDYLIAEGQFTKKGSKINASDFEFRGTREALIRHIESDPQRRKKMIELVEAMWNMIELKCSVARVNRYRKDVK